MNTTAGTPGDPVSEEAKDNGVPLIGELEDILRLGELMICNHEKFTKDSDRIFLVCK